MVKGPDVNYQVWLWKGEWSEGYVIMVLTYDEKYIAFDFDGGVDVGESNLRLERLPLSWELFDG